MLTKEQRAAIENNAITSIREKYWGGIVGNEARSIVDDVRTKIIEEGWFGRPVSGSLNEPGRIMNRAPIASASELYGHAQTTAADFCASAYETWHAGAEKMSDLYGEAIEQASKMADLYGEMKDAAAGKRSAFYGYDAEHEHDDVHEL